MPKRIIWVIDAFADGGVTRLKTAELLTIWARHSSAAIEPVMVLHPERLKTASNYLAERSGDALEHVTKLLKSRIDRLSFGRLLPPRVLISPDRSLRSAVTILIAHAKRNNAVLIAAPSRSPKKVSHIILGSFAEALALQSDIPVFLVTRRMRDFTKISKILFPTDLSEASSETLIDVARLATAWDAEVSLFHKIESPKPGSMNAFHANRLYSRHIKSDIDRRKQVLREWTRALRAQGVHVKSEVDESPGLSVGDSIVARARAENSSIIAMTSQTGPGTAAIPGNATRRVIRKAACPLWIVHRRKKWREQC